MDATTWNSRKKAKLGLEMERVIAWSFVAIAHVLFAWLATRTSMPPPVIAQAMELVFIQLPAPASEKKTRAIRTQAAPTPPQTARLTVQPNPAIALEAASDGTPAAHLQETTANDHWDMPTNASTGTSIPGIKNNPMHRFNPIQMGPPERFRMRKPITPADVVRAISMELFWPPGYTDDPCGGLAKAVQVLSAGTTKREHRMLEDAVLQQSRYCN